MAVNTSTSIKEGELKDSVLKKGSLSSGEMTMEAAKAFKKAISDEQVDYSIPVILAGKMGNPFYIDVNGVTVGLPVDGKNYKIPKVHAERITRFINELT